MHNISLEFVFIMIDMLLGVKKCKERLEWSLLIFMVHMTHEFWGWISNMNYYSNFYNFYDECIVWFAKSKLNEIA